MSCLHPPRLTGVLLLAPWLACLMVACVEASSVDPGSSADDRIAFYRARIGGPGTYPVQARLGLAYFGRFRDTGRAEDYDEALKHLRQSLDYQRNFEALLGMAEVLSEKHWFKQALPFAEEATATLPADLQAKGVLFDIRLALGDITEAQLELDAMLRAKRGFESLSRLAALREATGNYPGALEAMNQAFKAAKGDPPSQAWAEVRVGSFYVAHGEAVAGREAYEQALVIRPKYYFALEHLAELNAAQTNWDEAERLFRKVQLTHPSPQYRLALAEVYSQQGKSVESQRERSSAQAELRQAAQQGAQDPFRPLALLCLEDPKTVSEGLRWAERDWKVRQDALTADTLAWAHQCNGQPNEALRFSELALHTGNASPLLLLHGGLIRCRAGHTDSGNALLQRALACPLAFGPHERALATSAEQESAQGAR